MLAGRTVAILTLLSPMDVVGERLSVGLVTGHAQLIEVDKFGVDHLWLGNANRRILFFLKPEVRGRPPTRDRLRLDRVDQILGAAGK